MVLDETDLDEAASRATAADLHHDGPSPAAARILQIADPVGIRIVVTGA